MPKFTEPAKGRTKIQFQAGWLPFLLGNSGSLTLVCIPVARRPCSEANPDQKVWGRARGPVFLTNRLLCHDVHPPCWKQFLSIFFIFATAVVEKFHRVAVIKILSSVKSHLFLHVYLSLLDLLVHALSSFLLCVYLFLLSVKFSRLALLLVTNTENMFAFSMIFFSCFCFRHTEVSVFVRPNRPVVSRMVLDFILAPGTPHYSPRRLPHLGRNTS